MVYSGKGMTDLQTYIGITDLETYILQLTDQQGMRELTGVYDLRAEPPYFYQYEDDGSIYVHTRFIGQSNAVVGIFALDGSFIYGGAATTTH
jgi:hypothetical protein